MMFRFLQLQLQRPRTCTTINFWAALHTQRNHASTSTYASTELMNQLIKKLIKELVKELMKEPCHRLI